MVQTIGNPFSWTAQAVGRAAGHFAHSVDEARVHTRHPPKVRQLTTADLAMALRKGVEDFGAARADVLFLVLLYPVIGLALVSMALRGNTIPLIFPMIAGFALLGPLAAVFLYEISRRRDLGESASWRAALGLIRQKQFGAVVVLGLYMIAFFALWLTLAHGIFALTLGPEAPASLAGFFHDVFTTRAGWAMIVIGSAVGGLFALIVLAVSTFSFPMLIDRHVGLPVAVATSIRVFFKNPVIMLIWGAMVGLGLMLGTLPALVGLMVVLPVFGHATWHLYRRAVV